MTLVSILSPFVASLSAGLFGRWLGARGSGSICVLGLGISAMCSLLFLFEICAAGSPIVVHLSPWFESSTVSVAWTFQYDSLTAIMMMTVTLVSLCVHCYSLGYMQHDPHLVRFMSYLSLFTGGMLLLVSARNLVILLVGWELIGVASFLLIGFWFHRLSATKSAVQAMLVNRVSDTALIVGLIGAWWYLGSMDLTLLTATSKFASYTDVLCVLLLCGALGKSAQVGLHVWLANAMEGPTPVSALIHAATLVTAGIYLIARTSSLWEASSVAQSLLVWVGAITSLMAASLGLVQTDLKRVIAYSTCSQLGYMMVALGYSHYGLAIYHLMTHAGFKALLFLGAGVVIHATADNQDLRRYGGGHYALPFAWGLLLLASLSLVGFPFLSGYYSKDAILELAWSTTGAEGSYGYFILMLVAAITSCYSFKVLLGGFVLTPNARKNELSQPGSPYTMIVPLLLLALLSVTAGFLFSDMLIGWGSAFWNLSIENVPTHLNSVSTHMLPTWTAWLPFATVFIGLALAFSFIWPLPWFSSAPQKAVYMFLLNKWQFDVVINQLIALPVLKLGAFTGMTLDKGALEILGSKGLTYVISDKMAPLVKHTQTGAVQDYALVFQILVILGIGALALGFTASFFPFFNLNVKSTSSSGKDTALSRREREFKSRRG